MSCLPDCSCTKSVQEIDSAEERTAHEEPSYHPLSEASYLSEAIPLLPKDSNMLKYEANSEHYDLLAVIGHGFCNAAKISLARHIPSGQHVAIRRIDLDKCTDLNYVHNEIIVYRQLRHENILPYLCTFVKNCEIWAVTPLLSYGSTKTIMRNHFPDGLPEIAISFIIKDILFALDYLHKRGFIHRSLKSSHILISSSGKAVLTGLRYSCNVFSKGRWQTVIHSFPHDSVPNLNWLSPELLGQGVSRYQILLALNSLETRNTLNFKCTKPGVPYLFLSAKDSLLFAGLFLNRKFIAEQTFLKNLAGYNSKADIYSLGITVWELSNGMYPFAKVKPTQMLLEKLQGNILQALNSHGAVTVSESNGSSPVADKNSSVESNHKLGDGSVYLSQVNSESFQSFIQICLQKDPDRRPTAAQLKTHAFIKQIKKSQISLLDVLAIVSPVVDIRKVQSEEDTDEAEVDQIHSVDDEDDDWIF